MTENLRLKLTAGQPIEISDGSMWLPTNYDGTTDYATAFTASDITTLNQSGNVVIQHLMLAIKLFVAWIHLVLKISVFVEMMELASAIAQILLLMEKHSRLEYIAIGIP